MRTSFVFVVLGMVSSPSMADDAPWRPSARKMNQDCTLDGAVSKVCVDLYIKVEDGRAGKGAEATGGEKQALTCILTATKYLSSSKEYRSEVKFDQTSSATELVASGDDAPYAKECIRATTLAVGNDTWKKRGNELKKRAAWSEKMRETVQSTFRKKCGVSATLDGDSFAELAIERVSRNSKVFYDGLDGTGMHVRVTCGGQITMHSASGGTMSQTARTWDQQSKDFGETQCLQSCANTNKVCLENHENITVAACRNACLPSCS